MSRVINDQNQSLLYEDDINRFLNLSAGEDLYDRSNLGNENVQGLSPDSSFLTKSKTRGKPRQSTPNATNLKDLELAIEKYKKENFSLKLKLFYMQEKITQQSRSDNTEDIIAENIEQRVIIEERTKELEERNRLLIKARNAIESLQTDIELLRTQSRNIQLHEVSELQRWEQAANAYKEQSLQLKLEIEQINKQRNDQIKQLQDKIQMHDYRSEIHLSENEKLRQAVNQLQNELSQVRDVENKLKTHEELQGKLMETQHQLLEKQKEVNKLKEENADKNFQLEVSVADYRLQLDEKSKLLQETFETLENLNSKQQALIEERDTLSATVHNINNDVNDLKNYINVLEVNERKIKQELNERSKEITRYIDDLTLKSQQLNNLMKEKSEKEFLVQRLQLEKEDQKKQIDQIIHQSQANERELYEKLQKQESGIQKLHLEYQNQIQEKENKYIQERNFREDLEIKINKQLQEMEFVKHDFKVRSEQRDNLLHFIQRRLVEIFGDQFQVTSDQQITADNFPIYQEYLIDLINRIDTSNSKLDHSLKEMKSKYYKSADLQNKLENRNEQIEQLQLEIQNMKEETSKEKSQIFQNNQRLQILELELEQKNLMLASWAKDKSELEEKRLLLSHLESDRVQFQNQLQKCKEEIQLLRQRELMKNEDDRKMAQLKSELDTKKKTEIQLENESKVLMDRVHYLESQIQKLNENKVEANNERVKDLHAKISRLSENNRLLILELEEKRTLTQEISKKYHTIHKENSDLKSEIRYLRKELSTTMTTKMTNDMDKQLIQQIENTQTTLQTGLSKPYNPFTTSQNPFT